MPHDSLHPKILRRVRPSQGLLLPGTGRKPSRVGHQLPHEGAVEPSAPIPSLPGIGERVDRTPMLGDLRTPDAGGVTDEVATCHEGKPHANTYLAEPGLA